MKTITTLFKYGILTTMLLAFSNICSATNYTATSNGNFSDNATWGGTAPGANITGADAISIPGGITVYLDVNLTLDNLLASLAVDGTLSGNYNLTITSGTLQGNNNGTVSVNKLTLGAGGYITHSGNISVKQLDNSQLILALTSTISIADSLILRTGSVTLNAGSTINLADNATVIIWSGSLLITDGSVNVSGGYNLVYNGLAASVGSEGYYPGIHNVTVDLATNSSQLSLSTNLTMDGSLYLQKGILVLNGNSVTLNGTVNTTGSASISGDAAASITINSKHNAGTLAFSSSDSILGFLTVNIDSDGVVFLGSDLTVAGTLSLNNGSLDLNGHNLAVNGVVSTSDGASISGNAASDVTFNGDGNMGNLAFSAGNDSIHNFAVNITSGGSLDIGSDVTVTHRLILNNGTINVSNYDLTVASSARIDGGSDTSYVVTGDTGTLVMTIAAAGDTGMFHIGTQNNYAPVKVTNLSSTSGIFSANAHSGVFASGTTGMDISADQAAVNTGWDIESSITSNLNVNVELFWNSYMEVNDFDNSQAYVSHYSNGHWSTGVPGQANLNANGMYSATFTGATSLSPFAVFDTSTVAGIGTGIKDIRASTTLNIYPNPASDVVELSNIQANGKYDLLIYNVNGQLMERRQASGNTLDISNLSAGFYTLSVYQNGDKYVSRLVVAK